MLSWSRRQPEPPEQVMNYLDDMLGSLLRIEQLLTEIRDQPRDES
jgi:hypothetical protein